MIDKVNNMDPWSSDVLELAIHIDRLMRQIHAELEPRARALDEEKVGPLGGMVLMTIEDHAPISLNLLARLLARDKGQMTRHVQMLERRRLLLREPSEQDRRVTHIRLTDKGRDRVGAFRGALADVVGDMFSDVSSDDQIHFLTTLKRLVGALSDAHQAGD
ncbi:MAG: MarR family winged helix-turn-helix transcriptional regulator [Pseudomonadota bacterium]